MHRVHLVVRGRVQGVGFRYFVVRRAAALGLDGWVSNRADGSVEVEAEGGREALASLVEALRQGPSQAHVTDVLAAWDQGEPRHRGFDVR